MPYNRTFVCVANSTKNYGRCIAGIEIDNGELGNWIRPVSGREGREISEDDRRFENGKTCGVFDVVSVAFDKPDPFLHQTENHVIDDRYYWTKVGELSPKDLEVAIENYKQPIWPHCQSTNYGHNDKIPQDQLPHINSSLTLIQPKTVEVVVSNDPGFNGAPSQIAVRAKFFCGGQRNSLKISDPKMKEEFMGRGVGTYTLDNPIMCISLAEPWAQQPYAFKVVATVIMP